MAFPQWVVLYYRTVWFHRTETKNAHELLTLVASWGLIVTFSMRLEAKKNSYCWSFQLLKKQLDYVPHLSSAGPVFSILFSLMCYLTCRAKFLHVESWNMDHINIFKGINEQLIQKRELGIVYVSGPGICPQSTLANQGSHSYGLTQGPCVKYNVLEISHFAKCVCSLLSVVFWIYQSYIFKNQFFVFSPLPTQALDWTVFQLALIFGFFLLLLVNVNDVLLVVTIQWSTFSYPAGYIECIQISIFLQNHAY